MTGHEPPGMGRETPRWLIGAFVLSLVLVNPYVRGDGNGYYAWLVSCVIDHDADFTNQYRHGDRLFQTLMFEPDGRPRAVMITATGHLENQWSVGPAMLWAPWFLVAHVFVHLARLCGSTMPADGYAWPYRWACAIGTATYGFLALVLARRCAAIAGQARGALIATLSMWAASPLPVYQYFIPFHVHALAAFAVAWFVWMWLSRRPLERPAQWWAWGAVGGVMTVVYQLNAVLLLIAVWQLLVMWRRVGVAPAAAAATRFSAMAAVVWMPQLVGKAIVYGTPWTTGYHDRFFWMSPRLWQTAFSTEHGLFTWTPIAAIAVCGFVLAARERRELVVAGVSAAVFFFAVASYQNWHGQSSFGNRFFVSLIVLAVIGVACLATRLAARGRLARAAAVTGLTVLVVWNAGLAFQWGTNLVPNRGPVDFRVVARNQVTIVPSEAARFLGEYFRSRQGVAQRLEQQDERERRDYRLIR